MDSVAQAIVLGLVQGMTEFLPVSSSAHLLVLPWILNWRPQGVTFDVMLHGGTLAALLLYFRRDLRVLAREMVEGLGGKRQPGEAAGSLGWALLIGTIPAGLVGLLLRAWGPDFRRPAVVAATLSLFGIALWIADRLRGSSRDWRGLTLRDGAWIGMAQSLALIPGVSRSGITITAALLLGFSRADSARFSFLLGIPIIALATAAKTFDLIQAGPSGPSSVSVLAVGVLFSFASGFLCIKYFLRFLQRRSLECFALYRLLLGAGLCCWLWWR